MNRLETTFAGLKLKNPIIVASSGMTDSVQKNIKHARAGAGAIVLKSLFEEQIMMEALAQPQDYEHTEGDEYFFAYYRGHKVAQYLDLISQTKAAIDIPVIASINCFSNDTWIEFARELARAGADALEINILALQTNPDAVYGSFEQRHVDILKRLKEVVSIPIVMKLGSNFTNPVALIQQLYREGVSGVVLFNRFYQPDIDIDSLTQTHGSVFTSPSDFANSLRWVGIASAQVEEVDIAASGGVSKSADIIKFILAGASAVQVCSAIYNEGSDFISDSLEVIEKWMNQKKIDKLSDVQGQLNVNNVQGINTFGRNQFLRYFTQKDS